VSLDVVWLLALAAKLSATAGLVVAASLIAERVGALIGSLVATLPISAGPAYVFLAAEHDDAFIAEGALISFATNPSILIFSVFYVLAARRFGLTISLVTGLLLWCSAAYLLYRLPWTVGSAIAFNAVTFGAAIAMVRKFRHAEMPRIPRRWYDLILRAGLVVGLMGTLLLLSNVLGPARSGAIAIFPVVFTSMILILHPRVGPDATAAVIANGLSGLIGFAVALLTLHAATIPLGAPAALSLALAVCVAWNLLLFALRSRRGPAVQAVDRAPS
jgi:hypothetical protein